MAAKPTEMEYAVYRTDCNTLIEEDNSTMWSNGELAVSKADDTGFGFSDMASTTTAILTVISMAICYLLARKHLWRNAKGCESEKGSFTCSKDSQEEVIINDDSASIWSLLTYNWVQPLLVKGYNNTITSTKDMFPLPNSLNIEKLRIRFSTIFQPKQTSSEGQTSKFQNKKTTLLKALHKAYGLEFYLLCGILELTAHLLWFAGPISLNKLISFFENGDEPSINGYYYVCLLFWTSFGKVLFYSRFDFLRMRVFVKVRISIMTTIYQKALTISTVSMSKFSTGEIVNFLGTDTNRILGFCHWFHAMWSMPFQTIVSMYLLYQLVGNAFLGGLVVALLLVPIHMMASTHQVAVEKILMDKKDKRVKMMNEVLGGIKIIKVYTWEDHFRDAIDKLRKEELQTIRRKKVFDVIMEYLWTIAPVLMTILTFTLYSMTGQTLTAAKVLTCLTLLSRLLGSLNNFPMVFNTVTEAFNSLERVEKFVALKDVDLDTYYKTSKGTKKSDEVISMKDGRFTWEEEEETEEHSKASVVKDDKPNRSGETTRGSGETTSRSGETPSRPGEITSRSGTLRLRNININITQGQFIGVIGKVGSGKSSLLNALLAEMYRENGEISVPNQHHGFALADQESWIQHATIRDNILFGTPFNTKKYEEVLNAASLIEDIKMLPAGDKTEVGEKGVTLSGGQKARLALARALYQDKEVYLLDDPLAAVDAHVAQHMYDKCIMGLLKNKTRILCTHHAKFLGKADLVIVMDDGAISKIGPPSEVLATTTFAKHKRPDNTKKGTTKEKTEESDNDGKLGEEETKETGEVKSRVYKAYISALGNWLASTMVLSIIFMQVFQNLTNWWLTHWVSNDDAIITSSETCPRENISLLLSFVRHGFTDPSQSTRFTQSSMVHYLVVYGCLAGIFSLFSLAREISFACAKMRVARIMHNNLLNTILKAPMSFFDVTPIGRILNRYSSDLGSIDDTMTGMIKLVLSLVVAIVGNIFICCYGMPWFLLLLIPVIAVFYRIQEFYRPTSREIRRICSITRSPIFAHFSETVSGVVTIRAFRESERFMKQHMELLSKHLGAHYTASSIGDWFGIRTRMMGSVMVTGIALLAVVEHHVHGVDPGLVGLAISYPLLLSGLLDRLVNSFSETEKQMVSVERVQQYIDDIPSERWTGSTSSPAWSATGEVSYIDVHMKYREGLPKVLKGLTFNIRHAEKVGIVGRTGSGKSSIFQTLFRTVEICDGVITVDGENIRKLDLKTLRKHLAMIPQDPFLFSGTVRENLDPTSRYSDEELWGVLDRCHLRLPVDRLGGLEGGVAEKGRHFSVGQRQLMCLARALLTKAKVLCIDEATASVDLETDMLIQETIREEFKDSTVLTIAHRINTIMDSDRVLVMDQGQVAELDSPENLLRNPESAFYKLVHGHSYEESRS